MKQKLLLLYIAFSFFACKPEPKPIPDKHNYYYLTAEQLAKTPYFTNPAFDTLTFVSNQNDTVVFAKTRVDSGWYKQIDFNPGVEFTTYHYYQQISANYQTIKGDGSFGVVHSKKGFAYNTIISDILKISFFDQNYYINDYFIGINHIRSIDSINIKDYTYKTVTRINNNWVDSNSSISYVNKEFGAFYFNFLKSNQSFDLINKQ
jgi:hypothetical protein